MIWEHRVSEEFPKWEDWLLLSGDYCLGTCYGPTPYGHYVTCIHIDPADPAGKSFVSAVMLEDCRRIEDAKTLLLAGVREVARLILAESDDLPVGICFYSKSWERTDLLDVGKRARWERSIEEKSPKKEIWRLFFGDYCLGICSGPIPHARYYVTFIHIDPAVPEVDSPVTAVALKPYPRTIEEAKERLLAEVRKVAKNIVANSEGLPVATRFYPKGEFNVNTAASWYRMLGS